MKLIDLLLQKYIVESYTEAKRFIFNRFITINGVACNTIYHQLFHKDIIRVGNIEIIYFSKIYQRKRAS
jgi:ribosome-associated protein YbcJ (S4-like RNA binding protein)